MKRPVLLLSLLLGSFCAASAPAAVFERDWKVEGDGLLTFDDVNQREWLDVPVSLLADFGGFDEVVAETGPNGMFDGFAVARFDDVLALAASAGINVNSTSHSENEDTTRHLLSLLGETYEFPPNNSALTRGYLEDIDANCNCLLIANIFAGPSGAGINSFSVAEDSNDRPFNVTGVFLFRPVPEPSSWLMATMSAAILLLSFRKHRDVTATLQ